MLEAIPLAVLVAVVALVIGSIVLYWLLEQQARRLTARIRFEHARYQGELKTRQQAENALQVRDKLFRILFDHTTDMVMIYGVTAAGLPAPFHDVNDHVCETLEYTREHLLKLTALDVEVTDSDGAVPGFTRTELATLSDRDLLNREATFTTRPMRRLIQQILERGQVEYTHTYQTRTGKRVPVDIVAYGFDLKGQTMIISAARDITQRRAVERALRESEKRFEDFFSRSPIGVVFFDAMHVPVNVNQAALKLLGIPDRQQFEKFDPFAGPFVPDAMRRLMERGDTAQFEMSVDFERVRRESIFLSSRKGEGHFDVLMMNLGLDIDYAPRGWLMQIQDITRRVETEAALQQSARQLQQAQKMEALGTLAGGIAHDFNNILTPILGYADIMLSAVADTDPNKEFLLEINKASNRARDLVQQILTFSRQAEAQHQAIHVLPIIKEVLKLQSASMPPGITVNRTLRTDRDLVMMSPIQMHQILMNLCANAVYAMRESGGTLDVTVSEVQVGARSQSEFPDIVPGSYLRLTLRDVGVGMDEQTLDRLFEPFYTTKPHGEGTGMGLAVVHGIITSVHGAIRVESERGKGTVFHIVLPLVEETDPVKVDAVDDVAQGSTERILVVEDDLSVARMTARMLRALEYDPTVARNGAEALEMLLKAPGKFHAVITDLNMPGMGGDELAERIQEMEPGLPVLLCTGYHRTADRPSGTTFAGIVRKPIMMRALATALRDVLAKAQGSS